MRMKLYQSFVLLRNLLRMIVFSNPSHIHWIFIEMFFFCVFQRIQVNTESGNGLVQPGNKPLPTPKLAKSFDDIAIQMMSSNHLWFIYLLFRITSVNFDDIFHTNKAFNKFMYELTLPLMRNGSLEWYIPVETRVIFLSLFLLKVIWNLYQFHCRSLIGSWCSSLVAWDVIAHHESIVIHYDVTKWKHFLRYWFFMRGIHRPPVDSLRKGQWRRALMFSLICAWTNAWAKSRDDSDFSLESPSRS